MRGVVFLGDRRLELREFPDPTPGPGEVVLAIKASGMCGSDLHSYRAAGGGSTAIGIRGRGEPVIAGHEPCGVVAAVGPGVSEAQARVGHHVDAGICGTRVARQLAGREAARSRADRNENEASHRNRSYAAIGGRFTIIERRRCPRCRQNPDRLVRG